MHPLDLATQLKPIAADRLAGTTSDEYWNFAGPFGGYTAAVLMRAVMDDPRRLGPPVAQTVNYCAPTAKGAFEIALKLQRSGKATQHWSLELLQDGLTTTSASIVCANRRDTFAHTVGGMPLASPPLEAARMPTDGRFPWFSRYDFRFVEGGPRFGQQPRATAELGHSRTMLWLKDQPDRPLDYVALSALSDCFILRLIQMRGTMPPMSTVSMTTYFHARPEELTRHGTSYLLGIADAKRFEANFHDQWMELWSTNGTLLASGVQTVWYKE